MRVEPTIHSSLALLVNRKRKLFASLLYSYRCIVTINVLCLFLTVPCVGLQCVIVVLHDHTHLHFGAYVYWSKRVIIHTDSCKR